MRKILKGNRNLAGEIIVDAVAAYTGIERERMESSERGRVADARALAAYLCRQHTYMSLWQITHEIGYGAHNSTLGAIRRAESGAIEVVQIRGDGLIDFATAVADLRDVLASSPGFRENEEPA